VPKIVDLVADAGPEAGLGHVSRSSAIAVALRTQGIEVRCYAYGVATGFERDRVKWSPLGDSELPVSSDHVLVIDSYRLRNEVLEHAAASAELVLLHDQGVVPIGTALVVTTVEHAADSGIRRLAGFEYAALRPAFWGLPPREIGPTVAEVLVTTGSGAFAEVGVELASAAADALPKVHVSLVRGPYAGGTVPDGLTVLNSPESLSGPLLASDLAITAGGQTMLEAAAAGTPTIAVSLIANQDAQSTGLAARGAVELVDPHPATVAAAVAALDGSVDARRRLSHNAQREIDGYGALRVGFAIARLAESSGSLNP
jgi:spore coat polysaccharide biosynthesis predicted glycosyltransferase SpsG